MAIELVESGSHRSGGNDDDEESSATLLSPEARLSSSEGLPPPKRADIRAYWLPRRLAVRAVHRGYAWQIACACSAIGTLMGSCRAVGLWALCKYYLHSAYIMTPAAIEALLDASFLVALCLAEPNSVPPKRRVDWIAPEYDEPDEEDNSVSVGTSSVDSGWGNNDNELSSRSTNPSTSSSSSSQSSNNSSSKSSGRGRMAGAMKNAAKRMDLYMTHVFKRTRLRRKERKAGRQGLNRLGIRMPKEYAQFVTPRRRGACAVGMLWALADGTLSVVGGLLSLAVRVTVTLEPDGVTTVQEWPGLRIGLGAMGYGEFVLALVRLIQALSLLQVALLPRAFLLDDPYASNAERAEARAALGGGVEYGGDDKLKRKKQLAHRRWTVGARLRRPLLVYAVFFWSGTVVLFSMVTASLVASQFKSSALRQRGATYWDRWLPFPSERLTVFDPLSATQVRVNFPEDALPPLRSANKNGAELDVDLLLGWANPTQDGFAASGPLLFSLPNLGLAAQASPAVVKHAAAAAQPPWAFASAAEAAAAASTKQDGGTEAEVVVPPSLLSGWVPTASAAAVSVDPWQSTTLVLNARTGEPVPHWMELDAWAPTTNGNAVLMPANPLDHGDWYVVLVRGLTDSRDGRLLPKAPGLAKAQRDFLSSSASSTSSSSSSSSPWGSSSGGSSVDASGIGRPATLADDDVVVSQAQTAQNDKHAAFVEPTPEDILAEQRLLALRALHRAWTAPCPTDPLNPSSKDPFATPSTSSTSTAQAAQVCDWSPWRAWVSDERLQLAFAFPVASKDSGALAAPSLLRNATETWLEQQPRGAALYRVSRVDAERCEAYDSNTATASGSGGTSSGSSGDSSDNNDSVNGGYYDASGHWVTGTGESTGAPSSGSDSDPLGDIGDALGDAVEGVSDGLESGGQEFMDTATSGLSDDFDSEARGFTGTSGPMGRVVWANMHVPSFLIAGHASSRYSSLKAAGVATGGGHGSGGGGDEDQVGVLLALPCSVLTGHSPLNAIVQYGHGLFDDRSEALESWLLTLAEAQGWAVVAADWRGLAKPDLPVVARALLARPDGFRATVDHLLQAQVDQFVLSALARPLVAAQLAATPATTFATGLAASQAASSTTTTADDADAAADTYSSSDSSLAEVPLVYYGLGNGAALGAGLASLSPIASSHSGRRTFFDRFVLGSVGSTLIGGPSGGGGGGFSPRSEGFGIVNSLMDLLTFDRQAGRLILALVGMAFEPASWPPPQIMVPPKAMAEVVSSAQAVASASSSSTADATTPTSTSGAVTSPLSSASSVLSWSDLRRRALALLRSPVLCQAAQGDATAPSMGAESFARALGAVVTPMPGSSTGSSSSSRGDGAATPFGVPLWQPDTKNSATVASTSATGDGTGTNHLNSSIITNSSGAGTAASESGAVVGGVAVLSEWRYEVEALAEAAASPLAAASNTVHECLRRDVEAQQQVASFVSGTFFANASTAAQSPCEGPGGCMRAACEISVKKT